MANVITGEIGEEFAMYKHNLRERLKNRDLTQEKLDLIDKSLKIMHYRIVYEQLVKEENNIDMNKMFMNAYMDLYLQVNNINKIFK